ncbi:MAG: MBOAT family protein [Prevotella sp.]|nr:MBOAT family protein [Prevotella sp.]
MLFNSFEYLLFLPIVFTLYWLLKNHYRWQNVLILIASYVFYGWWDWKFLLLIAFSTGLSYGGALLIEHEREKGKQRATYWTCTVSIVLNLAVLCVFKYYNFFVDNLIALFPSLFGAHRSSLLIHVVLPVGISFYTLQSVAYVIDVYKHKIQATKDAVAFFSFVSFFPQLVAGPIERANNLLPQFLRPRTFDYAVAVDGCRRILWGLFKKLVIADNCAVYVNEVWQDFGSQSTGTLLLCAVLFTLQIYGDFSGYSDIAIGSARLLGVKLMDNFRMPFFSRNMAEFWRRWHISLNSWFSDYVYIPLGGSREGKAKHLRNIFIVFLLSGLWHGANWTFIVWGLFLALCFVPIILGGKPKTDWRVLEQRRSLSTWMHTLLTFILFTISLIIFRAPDISTAFEYFLSIGRCSLGEIDYSPHLLNPTLIAILFMLVMEWTMRFRAHPLDLSEKCPTVLRLAIYYLLITALVLFSGQSQTFIYFQF